MRKCRRYRLKEFEKRHKAMLHAFSGVKEKNLSKNNLIVYNLKFKQLLIHALAVLERFTFSGYNHYDVLSGQFPSFLMSECLQLIPH